ncbi:MAG TPA: DNA polymerase IV [archaeon]|nr:DNA polymerase IV [archaeon]
MPENNIIFHIDMDAFFASAEEKYNQELKDKPVVIGADPKHGKGRGVVSTCNYNARKFGVKSAMPISKAYRLCPSAVFLPVNMRLYAKESFEVMNVIRKYAESFQQVSIDEAFMIPRCENYIQAEAIAKQIKNDMKEKQGISCSIGIGPNKSIAKIASDFKKPDGLTVVKEEDARHFIEPMPVRKLHGVGPKTESILNALGIKTIGDLAKADESFLSKQLGKWGPYLRMLANGLGSTEVYEEEGIQTISREYTFEEDTDDMMALSEVIDELSKHMHSLLVKSEYAFRTVTVKIRYSNFETHTKQLTIPQPSQDEIIIADAAKHLASNFMQSKKKIRLIGIRLSNLSLPSRQKSIKEYSKTS